MAGCVRTCARSAGCTRHAASAWEDIQIFNGLRRAAPVICVVGLARRGQMPCTRQYDTNAIFFHT
eukprot:3717805-Pyramimonas_sp.AAC.1